MTSETSANRPPATGSERSGQNEKVIESDELFQGAREVVIRHNQDRYVLRVTRQGKLILNK
jgi:hemin uptake protein HemP